MWSKLLTVLAMTMSTLLGDRGVTDRPMVQVRFKGSKVHEQLLYDSGAQVSLLSQKAFRKISVDQRPQKINLKLQCSGVSGAKLNIKGCYLLDIDILGQAFQHPFFVVSRVPGHAGVLGIDLIKRRDSPWMP